MEGGERDRVTVVGLNEMHLSEVEPRDVLPLSLPLPLPLSSRESPRSPPKKPEKEIW